MRQTMGIPSARNHAGAVPLLRLAPAVLLLAGGLAACAPVATNTTYTAAGIGRTQYVEYGTIIAMRPVTVQGSPGGVGTVAGAAAGGIAGSFIGGDPRSNLLGALGGAIIGGVAGNAIERGATTGQAIEFTIRTAQGDIALVQSNEENLQVGEQVRILRGERTRISRDVAVPPPGAYPPPSTTYQTPGYPPPGYQPPAYPPQPAYPDPNYPPPRY